MRWVLIARAAAAGREDTYLWTRDEAESARPTDYADHVLTRQEVLRASVSSDAIAQGTIRSISTRPMRPDLFRVSGWDVAMINRPFYHHRALDGQPDDAAKRSTLCYQVPYRSSSRATLTMCWSGRCVGAAHDSAVPYG